MKRSDAKIFLDSVLIQLRSMNECFSDTDFYDSFCDAYRKLSLIKAKL